MPPARDHYRSFRRTWWYRPGVLIPAAMLLVLSVPMIWWISTYDSPMAVAMFVITYVSLLVIVVRMMKATILEPHIRVHEAVLREEGPKLEAHRQQARDGLAATERTMLGRGEVTPVLDVWQIDPTLRQRHGFISETSTCRIDPEARELQVRVHLPAEWTFSDGGSQARRLLREVAGYARLVASDRYARELKPFASALVLELFALRDDGGLTGKPVPILSLVIPWSDMQRAAPDVHPPYVPGDLRFANGGAVEPHREIPPGAGTASK